MEQNSLNQKLTHEKEHWWTVTLMSSGGDYQQGYLSSPHTNITIQRLQKYKDAVGRSNSVVINMSYLGYMTKEYFQS